MARRKTELVFDGKTVKAKRYGCDVSDDQKPEFCTAMGKCLNDEANARGKGLTTIVVTNIDTGKSRFIGVAYKTSAKHNGVMLNNCPWCTQPLDEHVRDQPPGEQDRQSASA